MRKRDASVFKQERPRNLLVIQMKEPGDVVRKPEQHLAQQLEQILGREISGAVIQKI